jgi:phosphate transport system protein
MPIRRPITNRLPWSSAESSGTSETPRPASVIPQVDYYLNQIFGLVGEAIAGATHSLLTGDREAAKAIVTADEQVDVLALEASKLVQDALIGSGRTAVERRELIAVLRMLPELERNGDLAEHIARRAARGLGQEITPRARGLIERMGEVSTTIWRHTANGVADRLPSEAAVVEDLDDELDDLHVTVTAEVVSGSMALPVAIELAMVARFYERFGDHAVNLVRRMSILEGGSVEPPSGGAD